jgi:hypothetical protein
MRARRELVGVKVGLLESGRRPAKWPFIQWLYALTTISGELAPTSRLPKYRFLTETWRFADHGDVLDFNRKSTVIDHLLLQDCILKFWRSGRRYQGGKGRKEISN